MGKTVFINEDNNNFRNEQAVKRRNAIEDYRKLLKKQKINFVRSYSTIGVEKIKIPLSIWYGSASGLVKYGSYPPETPVTVFTF